MYTYIVLFLLVSWGKSAVPQGPCLCIGAQWHVPCLLPVCLSACPSYDMWMWFFSSPQESHKAKPTHTTCANRKRTISHKSDDTAAENKETNSLYFLWLKQLLIQMAWPAKMDCLEKLNPQLPERSKQGVFSSTAHLHTSQNAEHGKSSPANWSL